MPIQWFRCSDDVNCAKQKMRLAERREAMARGDGEMEVYSENMARIWLADCVDWNGETDSKTLLLFVQEKHSFGGMQTGNMKNKSFDQYHQFSFLACHVSVRTYVERIKQPMSPDGPSHVSADASDGTQILQVSRI